MRLSIRQKLADKMERMEKRGSYLCERNKELPLSLSLPFFFLYIGRGKLNYEVDCDHNGYATTGEVEQMTLQFATVASRELPLNTIPLGWTASIFFSNTLYHPPFILLLPANFGFARGGKSWKLVLSDSWEVDANVPK